MIFVWEKIHFLFLRNRNLRRKTYPTEMSSNIRVSVTNALFGTRHCSIHAAVVKSRSCQWNHGCFGYHTEIQFPVNQRCARFRKITLKIFKSLIDGLVNSTWFGNKQDRPKQQGKNILCNHLIHFGFSFPYGSSFFGLKTAIFSLNIKMTLKSNESGKLPFSHSSQNTSQRIPVEFVPGKFHGLLHEWPRQYLQQNQFPRFHIAHCL